MTDATARIKNLSIALARLHRAKHNAIADRVFRLLSHEITKEEERNYGQPARPAIIPATDPFNGL